MIQFWVWLILWDPIVWDRLRPVLVWITLLRAWFLFSSVSFRVCRVFGTVTAVGVCNGLTATWRCRTGWRGHGFGFGLLGSGCCLCCCSILLFTTSFLLFITCSLITSLSFDCFLSISIVALTIHLTLSFPFVTDLSIS